VKILVFDLDDTLLNRNKVIGPATRVALNEWIDSNGTVVLATSRPSRAVRRFIDPELLSKSHQITLNGAVCQSQGDTRVIATLGARAAELISNAPFYDDVHFSIELMGEHFASNREMSRDELAHYHSATPEMVLPLGAVDFDQVVKLAIDGLGDSLMSHEEWLTGFGFRIIPALNGTFLNVVHPSVDKSATLAWLLQKIDGKVEDVVAFGDDIPDLGLFEMAGTRVAMDNAVPELKASADLVIGDCDDDAIGEFIQEHCYD